MNNDLASLIDRVSFDGDITRLKRRARTVGWSEGRPLISTTSETEGYAIRYLHDGREAVVTTTALNSDNAADVFSRATDLARFSPCDPHRRLAQKANTISAPLPTDENIFRESVDETLEKLKQMETRILASDARLKKIVRFQCALSQEESTLVNSNGVNVSAPSTSASFAAEILAQDGDAIEVAWDHVSRRFFNDLSIEPMAQSVAAHALKSLHGAPIATGNYPMVIHPRVGVQLLGLLAGALSAEAIQLGRSFFQGALHTAVASPLITVVDDPLLPDGLASSAFDDEGTPHQRLTLINKGNLESYFYDLRTAGKDGVASTGHGIKAALSASPSPHPTNFFIASGGTSVETLLSSSGTVFYLQEVMGLHMADPITGEFSLGAMGFLYENGKFSKPVRGVTIAGTIKEIFQRVIGVGNDLTWSGSFAAPSLLVSELAISGT